MPFARMSRPTRSRSRPISRKLYQSSVITPATVPTAMTNTNTNSMPFYRENTKPSITIADNEYDGGRLRRKRVTRNKRRYGRKSRKHGRKSRRH